MKIGLSVIIVMVVLCISYAVSIYVFPKQVASYSPVFMHAMSAMVVLYSRGNYTAEHLERFRVGNPNYFKMLDGYLTSKDMNTRQVARMEVFVWRGNKDFKNRKLANQSLKPSPFRLVFQSPGSGQEFAD